MNLLEPAFGAAIIADYTPVAGYDKENLTSNLEIRTTRFDLNPTIDASGTTTTAFKSCFKIMTSQITAGDPFAMTIDLQKVHFVNSVLFVQDVLSGHLGTVSTADLGKYHATQIDVHIGNDLDWRNNSKCTLTPRLAADYKDSIKDWSATGN